MSLELKHRSLLSILFGLAGALFSLGFGLIGAILTGVGHGCALFGALVFSPDPFGALIWPLIGIAIPWAKNDLVAWIIVLLLAIKYVAVGIEAYGEGLYYVRRSFETEPVLTSFMSVGCLAVQAVIFIALVFLRKDHRQIT